MKVEGGGGGGNNFKGEDLLQCNLPLRDITLGGKLLRDRSVVSHSGAERVWLV